MYSQDDTLSIAQSYGARIVMHEPCNGIPEPARTFAVRQTTKDWVLVVDSDEVVPPSLKTYLYRLITQAGCPDACLVPRRNYFMNRYMRASFPDYQLRFFKKAAFVTWPVTVHSRPQIDGSIRKIPPRKELAFTHLEINHISAHVSKINRYTDRETERVKNHRAGILSLLFKPAFRFLKSYFIKGGILDGKEGFIFATMNAYYKYLAIAKSIEKHTPPTP
jgi:glycosyltransferase involved in cell wall biosynthesis